MSFKPNCTMRDTFHQMARATTIFWVRGVMAMRPNAKTNDEEHGRVHEPARTESPRLMPGENRSVDIDLSQQGQHDDDAFPPQSGQGANETKESHDQERRPEEQTVPRIHQDVQEMGGREIHLSLDELGGSERTVQGR